MYKEMIPVDECKITTDLYKYLKKDMYVRQKCNIRAHRIVDVDKGIFTLEYTCVDNLIIRSEVDFQALMRGYNLKIRGVGGIVI